MKIRFQELFINFVGGVLFITMGSLIMDEYYKTTMEVLLGCLCIITGIVFLIDFLFDAINTKFTVVTTTTTVTRNA